MTTNQKLTWVITEYGKRRITELLSNPDDVVRISIMNIGSDGTGTPNDREGAIPEEGDGRLFHKVNTKAIPIFEKGISTERENTIYFKAMIDENMCGYDICELAIYEERNGVEKMFAVGVGQPIVKPDIKDGYLMSVEYTLYIESTNLLDIYDRIELNPSNEFLKASDIDGLYRTILYVEGNMAEQISHNTHLLGLGRAQELDNLITNTQLKYNAASVASYYSAISNSIDKLEDILGFWSYNYTDTYGVSSNIKDFGSYANYLSTNVLLSSYHQEYLGVLSSLNFEDGDYYYIDAMESAMPTSSNIELGLVQDHTLSGSMIYAPDLGGWSYNRQIYSEEYVKENMVDYFLKLVITAGDIAFKDKDATDITIKVHPPYLDDEHLVPNPLAGMPVLGDKCYGPHTWTFNGSNLKWKNELAKELDILAFKAQVVDYDGTPQNGYKIYTGFKAGNCILDGVEVAGGDVRRALGTTCIAPCTWVYDSLTQFWSNREWNQSMSASDFKTKILNYTNDPANGSTVKTISATVPNRNEIVQFTGKQFDFLRYETDRDTEGHVTTRVYDSPFTFIISLQHNEMNKRNTLFAQSSYFSGKHNFEIVKTEDNAIEVTLFSGIYADRVTFKTGVNAVPSSIYNLVVTYDPQYDDRMRLDPMVKVYINNKTVNTVRTQYGNYTGMKANNLLPTTSYVNRIDTTDRNKNIKADTVNAKVCLMALIREALDVEVARCNSLILSSLSGKNVYYRV